MNIVQLLTNSYEHHFDLMDAFLLDDVSSNNLIFMNIFIPQKVIEVQYSLSCVAELSPLI